MTLRQKVVPVLLYGPLDFDNWWEWWVEKAPPKYLKHVDTYMFVAHPANIEMDMRGTEVRARWRQTKTTYETNYLMKHWLLVLIRSVYDKLQREKLGLQKHCRGNLFVYWKTSIFRCFCTSKFTLTSRTEPVTKSAFSFDIFGKYREEARIAMFTGDDANLNWYLSRFSWISFDVEDVDLFANEFALTGVRCYDWLCWPIGKLATPYFVFPFLEHAVVLLRNDLTTWLTKHVIGTLVPIIHSHLGLYFEEIDNQPFSWIIKNVLPFFVSNTTSLMATDKLVKPSVRPKKRRKY